MGNVPVINGVCPPNWLMFGNKCYIQPTGPVSISVCQSSCAALYPPARLLCIGDLSENNFIRAATTGYVWLGLNDLAQEGTFVWRDSCTATYRKWYPGEPNGGLGENVVAMAAVTGTYSGTWVDIGSSINAACMCEIYALGRPTSQPSSQPSRQPSSHPTRQPSSRPSRQPSSQPSSQPTRVPTSQPTGQPSSQPRAGPTSQPSGQPSKLPSGQPSAQPIFSPTAQPSRQPTGQPSRQPSAQPSRQPSTQPSGQPSMQPSRQPSSGPAGQPSSSPSRQPSAQPSAQPSGQPSPQPSSQPSRQPTSRPSAGPSSQPTRQPSLQPSASPSSQPSCQPSRQPTGQPTGQPSSRPTGQPSIAPSGQPSSRPSAQPSRQPSTQPSRQPSSQPSRQPSAQPSTLPTSQPSLQPSSRPTVQPTAQPSMQPSAQPSPQPSATPSLQPSSVPTNQPSTQPTTQPVAVPTAHLSATPSLQPSAKPSTQPSSTPTIVPRAQPTSIPTSHLSSRPSSCPTILPTSLPSHQPTGRPTAQPSLQPANNPSAQPTGQPSRRPASYPTALPTLPATIREWMHAETNMSIFQTVAYVSSSLWWCGVRGDGGVSCAVTGVGAMNKQYTFPWRSVDFVITTVSELNVVVTGINNADTSDVAICSVLLDHLSCDVRSFISTTFLSATYNMYAKRIVHIGFNAGLSCASIIDSLTGTAKGYVFTANSVREFTLSRVVSPAGFVGSMVAGTAVCVPTAPNQIVCGWLRTDTGQLSAMSITPTFGAILNSAGLVTSLALEPTGPDSFIAGAINMDDTMGLNAYVVRANALFSSISYGVRFLSHTNQSSRRLVGSNSVSSSSVQGLVLVGDVLYVLISRSNSHNTTCMSVLMTRAETGEVIKQAHVSCLDQASLSCVSMVAMDALLVISCSLQYIGGKQHALLLAVDRDLSFEALPAGCIRTENDLFSTERVAFKRTVLSVSSGRAEVVTTSYVFTSSPSAPSVKPSVWPTSQPSTQPSAVPTVQPSSRPTAVPTVSSCPTSRPSTADPTSTHRPSCAPTCTPTCTPTCKPTVSPTLTPIVRPSIVPTVGPTVLPSCMPSATRSSAPTRYPSTRLTHKPTPLPSVSDTIFTSAQNTIDGGNSSDLPPYVVGVSVGGVLLVLVIGYAVYKYAQYEHVAKERALHKIAFFARQAEVVEAMHQEHLKFAAEEMLRLEATRMRKARRDTSAGRGAHAISPRTALAAPELRASHQLPSGGSCTNISSLHSSDLSSLEPSAGRQSEKDASQSQSDSWDSAMDVMEGGLDMSGDFEEETLEHTHSDIESADSAEEELNSVHVDSDEHTVGSGSDGDLSSRSASYSDS